MALTEVPIELSSTPGIVDNSTGAAITIDASSNVGIGRSSIDQPSAGATTLAIQGTDNNKAGAIRLYSADDSVAAYIYPDSTNGLSINTSTSHPMIFRTVGVERLRIDTSGAVIVNNTGGDAQIYLGGSTGSSRMYLARSGTDSLLFNVDNGAINFGTNNTERMRIDSSGNVGIGVDPSAWSTLTALQVGNAHVAALVDNAYFGANCYYDGGNWRYIATNEASRVELTSGEVQFWNAPSGTAGDIISQTQAMTLDSYGTLLVGKTTSNTNVVGTEIYSGGNAGVMGLTYAGRSLYLNRLTTDGDMLEFAKDGTTVGSIGTLSTNLTIGTGDTGLQFNQDVNSVIPHNITTGANVDNSINLGYSDGSSTNLRFKDLYLSGKVITGGNTTSNEGTISFVADSERCVITGGYDTGGGGILKFFTDTAGGTSVQRMSINNAGTVTIVGALSKGSGSFKIDHPLPAKTETHHLVHSFVEAPQADNIYRGKVELVDGSATVNIDTVSGMTEGTFVLLNTNTQCFTSNESGWTAVKGSVSGNILTITAQESCSDTISWLIIGERQDQHMLDTDWTDENGKVIVEPLKQEVAELEGAN